MDSKPSSNGDRDGEGAGRGGLLEGASSHVIEWNPSWSMACERFGGKVYQSIPCADGDDRGE